MLRKLRIKFIAIVMASVAVVLALVFTGICVSEYQRAMSSVDVAMMNALNRATEGWNGGPDFDASQGSFSSGSASSASSEGPGAFDGRDGHPKGDGGPDGAQAAGGSQFQGPRIGGEGREGRDLVPVAVYQVTKTTEAADLELVSGFATAEIDENVLSTASTRVLAVSDGTGTFDDLGLHYQKRTVETTTYVAFADTASTASWQPLALTLAIAALVVLAVFFLISLKLSQWALRPVEEAWTAQRQFVADASHELKTPLTVVLANTSILLKHPESSIASQSQWIESTQIEAENMQGLVNEMLELAQVESRSSIQHEQLDYSDLVDGLVLQFESVAFERGCTLESDIAENLRVNGDSQRLRKMVSTLIENALKYVDDGGEVTVSLSSAGGVSTLAIRNTGSIIASEDLPHIFDRFYRTDKARTSGTGGYGLGLAIAREIAREHEGDITCASSTSTGTTFTVTLPIE
ncbi:MAG: sensor histidine kinase [Eggerthellaceae bacterium]|nr:sensor histidine kinase [Eggerthellaceae bacterium]